MNECEILKRLVNIKYYKNADQTELLQFLHESFDQSSEEVVEVQDESGVSHLLVGLNCKLNNVDNALILSGHADTVTPGENWEGVESREDDEMIYGLGSSDMKAFIASVIANKEVLRNSSLPIVLAITCDEETDLKGIKVINEELNKRGIKAGHILVGEPTENKVVTSNRGNEVYVATLTGKSCHSSQPDLGINALYAMARVVTKIEDIDCGDDTLINVILDEGGKMPNQVCGFSKARISIRSKREESKQAVENQIGDIINTTSEQYNLLDHNFFSVLKLPIFERKESTCNDELCALMNSNEEEYFAFTEAGFWQENYPTASVTILGPGNLNLAHKDGEYCKKSELLEFSQKLGEITEVINRNMKETGKKL